MPSEIVIAVYRPKPGKERALEALIAKHVPTLRAAGLATSRPALLMRSADGAYLEVFEWKDGGASANAAHDDPRVRAIWDPMGDVCEFAPLSSVREAKDRFPHFRPVDGVTS
jgi:hypothetical protein